MSQKSILTTLMVVFGVLLAVSGIVAAMGNRLGIIVGLISLVTYGILWMVGTRLKVL